MANSFRILSKKKKPKFLKNKFKDENNLKKN